MLGYPQVHYIRGASCLRSTATRLEFLGSTSLKRSEQKYKDAADELPHFCSVEWKLVEGHAKVFKLKYSSG